MSEHDAERFDASMKREAAQLRGREGALADTDAALQLLQQTVAQRDTVQGETAQGETARRDTAQRDTARREVEQVRDSRPGASSFEWLRPRRTWVPIAVACVSVALVVALVWVRSGPPHIEPGQVPDTTSATTVTSAPAPTPVDGTPVEGAGALILPTFPNDKLVASLSAVSDTEWFALSDLGGVNGQSYPLLWHTTDGGTTWVDMPLSDEIAGMGGSVYFADAENGWIGSPRCCLASTHDGGVTWNQVSGVTPDGRELGALAIASNDDTVYLLADVPVNGNSTTGVMASPIGSDEFVWTGTSMGDARWGLDVNSAQLAVNSQGGWAIGFGVVRVRADAPDGATRTVDGEWVTWEPPCAISLDTEEPYTRIDVPQIALGVSPSGEHVVAMCDAGTQEGFPLVYRSVDGGTTFESVAPMPSEPRFVEGSWVVVTDDGTMIVGVAMASGGLLVQSSRDGGQTWRAETLFSNRDYYLPVSVTPSGTLVVVGKSDGPTADRGTEAKYRQPDGTWVPLAVG